MSTWQALRRVVVPGLALLVLALVVVPSGAAEADGGRHPYFNDGGTLRWYRNYAEALRVAKSENKLVFIESGRTRCSQCRRLCQDVLPDRAIRCRISAIAIGLAAECDRPEREVATLFRRYIPNPKLLPLVAFITPDGRWVTGFYGKRTVSQFSRDLAVAEQAWHRLNACRPAPRAPQPAPARAPEAMRAPVPVPAPLPLPVPEIAEVGPVADDDHADECEDDDCDPDCPNGMCTPPPAFGGPDDFLGALNEEPQPSRRDRVVEEAPRPERIASVPVPPAPAPDLRPNGFPAPVAAPELEAPRVRPVPTPNVLSQRGMPSPPPDTPHVATGDPDAIGFPPPPPPPTPVPARPVEDESARKVTTAVRPASTSRGGARPKAERAAARGQWGEVLRLTDRLTDDRELLALNRKAHAWAHDTLEDAVDLIAQGEVDDARAQIELVKREMAGRPEAEDARRGLDAIEFAKDLAYLSRDSLVRRAVTKNAYEKMRGSRWARLFR